MKSIFSDLLTQGGIRSRLILLVLALSAPYLIFVGWSINRQAGVDREHTQQQSLAMARLVAARVDDHVLQMDNLLTIVRHSISTNGADRDRNDALLARLRHDLPDFVNTIAVWDVDGRNIGYSDPSFDRSITVGDRKYFQLALATHDLAIDAPIVSRANGEHVAQFARAAFDAHDQPVAVVAVSIRLRALQHFIIPENAIVPEALVAINDQHGVNLARSVDAEKWIGKTLIDQGSMRANLAAGEGTREALGADGVMRLSGFTTATRAPWLVYVGVPVDVAMAPARARLIQNLSVGLAVVLVALAAAGLIGGRIAGAMRQLAHDATLLGAGDLTHRSTVSGLGEAGILAGALNGMAARLQRSAETLRKSEQHLQRITDSVPALIAHADRDQRYTFANAYYRDVLGVDPADMIGQSIRDVFGPERYPLIAARLAEALGGMPVTYEYTMNARDGVRQFRSNYLPHYDEQGNVEGIYILNLDITRSKVAEAAVAASERRLRTITDNLPALVCYIDRERVFRFNNLSYERLLNRPLSEITDHAVRDVYRDVIYTQLEPHIDRALAGERVSFELEWKSRDGMRNSSGIYVPHIDTDGTVRGIYGVIFDTTHLKRIERQLERLAQFDTLTGLPNRHQFNARLATAMQRSVDSGSGMALMFLDVDRFKSINDSTGHHGGDQVLKEFAQRLSDAVRPTDTVARLAGDEFVVILEGLHGSAEVEQIARRIIDAMQATIHIDGGTLQVSTSIGIAIRHDETDGARLLRRADEALYAAKGAGRGRYLFAA